MPPLSFPEVKNIIAIASGKKWSREIYHCRESCCSTGTIKELKLVLIDADISGPSVPTMFLMYEGEQPAVKKVEKKNTNHSDISIWSQTECQIGFLTPTDSAVSVRGSYGQLRIRQFIIRCRMGKN